MIGDFYGPDRRREQTAGLVIIPDPDELTVPGVVDDLVLIWSDFDRG